MRYLIKIVVKWFDLFGINLIKLRKSSRMILPFIFEQHLFYRLLAASPDNSFSKGPSFPCLHDKDQQAGISGRLYFYQDLYIAQKIFSANPKTHLDIGSRVDGLVAHIASFRPLTVIDIRPLAEEIKNIIFVQLDMMEAIPESYINYCDSISCTFALGHFGLGRYGDRLCPEGHLIGFQNIVKILKEGGMLYLSVPIGSQRIEFNAHRIFSVDYIFGIIKPYFELLELSYVDDNGVLHANISIDDPGVRTSFGCVYGAGIFEMKKKILKEIAN